MEDIKVTIKNLCTGLMLFSSFCALFYLGFFIGKQVEKKEQEKIAVKSGIGYYSVDQESGTVTFKYNF